ncbi:MAG: PAS domain S-box protein, partial [Bacteroidota bacterium]
WTISPVRGDDGTIQHWVSVQRDVTEQRERERDLRQTRELLDSIIETANVGICVTDKNGQFVRVNPAYTDLYGWSEEELIGEHFTKVVPPNSHADAADLHDRFIYDRNDETTGEWRVHGKDGAIRNVIITAGYLEQSGEPFKVTTVLDVTDAHKRKEALHAERDLLRSIFNTSAAAITVLNEHGTIIRANKRAQEVLGLVPSDVKGRTYNDPAWHITTVDGKPFPDDELPFAQVMNTEAPVYDIRHAIQWPNGDRRILSVNGAPLRDAEGTITGGVFVVENITEQVQIQHKLIEAKEEAESASRLKSAMIANMSHEVRTPITSMMGFAEILAEELEGRQAKHASTILRSSKRLYKTLASVLQLSKLRGGSYTPSWEEVDLRKVAAEVIETMQPKATNHGLTLEFAHPVHPVDTRTDPMAAQRIVTNLLDNAIKFTPAGGTVTVCVDQEQETPHEGAPYISVADTGIGIASEAIDEMFVAFKQESEGFARSHEGSGIGLAIVKQLVDEIGATITVESEKKAGTHMHVRFPQQSGETNAEDAGR